jgi:FkbM family methyltransferase
MTTPPQLAADPTPRDRHGFVARMGKQWIRPLLVPVARLCVRHAPHPAIRRAFWVHLITPFFIFSNSRFVARTVFGAAIAGRTDDIIQRHLFYFGVWEPNLTGFLSARLRPGDIFVDVGANIGYFTLLASRLVGSSGRVIAIEASPNIFARLSDNLKRNRVGNVDSSNVAVSDRFGTTQLFLGSDSNLGQTGTVARPGSRYECDIDTAPLDALLATVDVARVRFVKVDVEGAEWSVLQGMQGLLRDGARELEVFVELTPKSLAAAGRTVDDVLAMFAGCGFLPYVIENDYSAEGYMSRHPAQRPRRLRETISAQADVIFSRIDADFL